MGKVTLREIAERANVSISTVSLVLNGKARDSAVRISESTMQKVRGLALEMGYPRKGIIGLVVPQTDNYFTRMIASVRAALRQAGYTMAIGFTAWRAEEEDEEIRLMAEKGFDGLIAAISPDREDPTHSLLGVFLDRRRAVSINWQFPGIPSASVDHELCGYLATRHLLDLGHKRVCFVGAEFPPPPGTETIPIVDDRYRGYVRAVLEQSLPVQSVESVADFVRNPERASGAYCGRSLWALDLLSACVDGGLRVPDDVSIVGQDEDREKSAVRPRLTTVDVRQDEVGEIAARMLLDLMDGRTVQSVLLQPRLVVRESTRAAGKEVMPVDSWSSRG